MKDKWADNAFLDEVEGSIFKEGKMMASLRDSRKNRFHPLATRVISLLGLFR